MIIFDGIAGLDDLGPFKTVDRIDEFFLHRQRQRTAATIAPGTGIEQRRLAGLAATLAAHDPARVLERGYAMVTSAEGEVVSSAEAARAARQINVRFADDDVDAEVRDG